MAEDTRDLINLVLKDGTVGIETRPDLAPKHVAQIKKLVLLNYYLRIFQFRRPLDLW